MIRLVPPLGSMVFSLPAPKKPICRLSGDQKGYMAPSVPVKSCAVLAARDRIHNAVPPSRPSATKASCLPSGEIAKLLGTKEVDCGGRRENRTARGAGEWVLRDREKPIHASSIKQTAKRPQGSHGRCALTAT